MTQEIRLLNNFSYTFSWNKQLKPQNYLTEAPCQETEMASPSIYIFLSLQ